MTACSRTYLLARLPAPACSPPFSFQAPASSPASLSACRAVSPPPAVVVTMQNQMDVARMEMQFYTDLFNRYAAAPWVAASPLAVGVATAGWSL